MIVMKFGGTSVQDASAINRLIKIVEKNLGEKPLVVVSALAKVTRSLLEICQRASQQQASKLNEILDGLEERHISLLEELLQEESSKLTKEELNELRRGAKEEILGLMKGLRDFATALLQICEISPRSQAKVLSFGEQLSSVIVNAAFCARGIKSKLIYATDMIITDEHYLAAKPNMEISVHNIKRIVSEADKGVELIITQGFISSSSQGATTVLGFEGSDYSAAIIACALDAQRLEIWTDVDGIRSCDPRIIEKSKQIPYLDYAQAAQLAFLGARVLHPMTIEPCKEKNIPIYVKNSYKPDSQASIVANLQDRTKDLQALSIKKDLILIELQIKNYSGITRHLDNIFSHFRKYNLQPGLLSLDESSIKISLDSGQSKLDEALQEIQNFYQENDYAQIYIYRDKAQISLLSDNLFQDKLILDEILQKDLLVYMISLSATMKYMSIVVDKSQAESVLKELHEKIIEK